jgi:prepilin-type N-terminal cleavage/methylation domain-containing protein
MIFHLTTKNRKAADAGFTLAEILVSLLVFSLVSGGLMSGYAQINRMAEWSSMSLAAQAFAAQGVEQARAAAWRPHDAPPATGPVTGPGTPDELSAPTNYVCSPDFQILGNPASTNSIFWGTNYVSVTQILDNPPLRQIQCDCHWTFPLTGKCFTNTVILLRAPDQQ